jgi:hypothetical protein
MAQRFTDAELAAEYWGADVWDLHPDVGCERMETIERFATLPHFDEVPA